MFYTNFSSSLRIDLNDKFSSPKSDVTRILDYLMVLFRGFDVFYSLIAMFYLPCHSC